MNFLSWLKNPVYIAIAVVVLILLYVWYLFNKLVGLRNQIKNAWSQVDVQLKRRHDLIPNLMETTKGYMVHERATMENVTNARSKAAGAINFKDKLGAETELTQALGRFLLTVENYPDLKANQNFLALHEELTSTENRIAYARQFYNDSVLTYNNTIQMFPSNIVATMFAFKRSEFFEIEVKSDKEVPKVTF